MKIISFDNPPPPVVFEYRFFCFTGHFLFIKRKQCETAVIERGGLATPHWKVPSYLVIGAGLYEIMDKPQMCLNNKMEWALTARAAGQPISIISEEHFAKYLAIKKKQNKKSLFIIESFTTPGRKYDVHLQGLSCTCPNFIEDRAGFSMNDQRRLCKHLVKVLIDNQYVPETLKNHVRKIAIASFYQGGIPGYQGPIPKPFLGES